MEEFLLKLLGYTTGFVFNLMVIAYLNERKKMKIPEILAIMSWFSLMALLCIVIYWIGGIFLRIVYYSFCEIFRKRI